METPPLVCTAISSVNELRISLSLAHASTGCLVDAKDCSADPPQPVMLYEPVDFQAFVLSLWSVVLSWARSITSVEQ
jgi:hypothetical protein